jgi:hypothetical protein
MLSVVALTGLLAFGVDTTIASADSTGSISGTATNGVSGVANVCVTAYGSTSSFTATTNSLGSYTISNLPADNYIVEFDPSCAGTVSSTLAIQWYFDQPDIGQAASVSVGTGSVTGVNAALEGASSISGTVTNASSAAVPGVCVYLYTSDGLRYLTVNVVTAANGSYTFNNLQAATYKVFFDPTCTETISNSPYAFQYYSDEPDFGQASSITFSGPTTRTGVNASLAAGASISGTVTAPGAVNNAGVCVIAYGGPGAYFEGVAGTNAAGTYELTNLPADSYRVAFDPSCEGLQATDFGIGWYNGQASVASATIQTLSAGQALSGINDALGLGVSALSISTMSLQSGALSTAYSASMVATGGTGPYDWSASGLPPGLSISASTGAITGTPTGSGNFTASITVTDASTPVVSVTTSLAISIPPPPPPPTTATTTTVPITQTVCTAKTKTVTIHKVEVKNGKKVTVTVREKERVYKTVTIKKTEKIKGKKVVVITHKKELVKVCKTVIV